MILFLLNTKFEVAETTSNQSNPKFVPQDGERRDETENVAIEVENGLASERN